MSGRQDVFPRDEAAAAELPSVVEELSNPGPLALVSVPASPDLGSGLILPLHLLGHPAGLAVVPDGEVAAHSTLARTGPSREGSLGHRSLGHRSLGHRSLGDRSLGRGWLDWLNWLDRLDWLRLGLDWLGLLPDRLLGLLPVWLLRRLGLAPSWLLWWLGLAPPWLARPSRLLDPRLAELAGVLGGPRVLLLGCLGNPPVGASPRVIRGLAEGQPGLER